LLRESRSVTCYPIPGKSRALLLCTAFADGVRAAGGTAKVCTEPPAQLEPGAAVFYGVRPQVSHLWEQVKREGRDYYYIDNSYFDCTRNSNFRITKNRLQHDGRGVSNGRRFRALALQIKPLREDGDYTLICAQTDEFMRVVADDPQWLERTVSEQQRLGPVVIRTKAANRMFSFDLERARKVVTWSSAAAVNGLLAGVPVECSKACAAYGVASNDRERWASVLADNEWKVTEIQRGLAWRT
jgi:hypothetical protein